MTVPPKPGDRFREIATKISRFVEDVVRPDGDGWIIYTADGQRWRLTTPDVIHGEAFRFVGQPIDEPSPPTPQLMG